MSRASAFAAGWAKAPPHQASTARVQYRYPMRSSLVDLRSDFLHQLRVFCVLAADFGGELLGRGDPGLDSARAGELVLHVREHERLVHFRAEARERGFRSEGQALQRGR